MYYTDSFKLHDTHGVPLSVQLDIAANRENLRISIPHFYSDALKAGWKVPKAISTIREALSDHGCDEGYINSAVTFLERTQKMKPTTSKSQPQSYQPQQQPKNQAPVVTDKWWHGKVEGGQFVPAPGGFPFHTVRMLSNEEATSILLQFKDIPHGQLDPWQRSWYELAYDHCLRRDRKEQELYDRIVASAKTYS